MSIREPYPNDIERIVLDAAREASGTEAVRWDTATPTEAVLARWVLEARAAREARRVNDKDDPGEAAREQARTPATAHRRRVLNALLAAWDAYPTASLGWVLDRAAILSEPRGLFRLIDSVPDADLLDGLRAMV